MTLYKLTICALGIYGSFLSWALVQERLTTTPYANPSGNGPPEKFRSAIFLNTVQSFFCSIAALLYLYAWRRRDSDSKIRDQSFWDMVGLPMVKFMSRARRRDGDEREDDAFLNEPPKSATSYDRRGGYLNGGGPTFRPSKMELTSPSQFLFTHATDTSTYHAESPWPLLFKYAQCAAFQSLGSPFGFASVRHISFPTMILGKSCKLVPVMLMNILLYRRKFALHKYAVVAMVTTGISIFMLWAPANDDPNKPKKGAQHSSLLGLLLLTINLILDGAVNSTQDEIFSRYKHLSGAQMMFWMNLISTLLQVVTIFIPFPSIPILSPPSSSSSSSSELVTVLTFISNHPSVLNDIFLYSLCGATGQLFIFATLSEFGSLTLVTITVTRKLFTMLLSLLVYDHRLTLGQWSGVALVFGGIAVEAWISAMKKKGGNRGLTGGGGKGLAGKGGGGETLAQRVIDDKDKARLKDI